MAAASRPATTGKAMSDAASRIPTVTRNASGPSGQSAASARRVGHAASVRQMATITPAAYNAHRTFTGTS